MTQNDLIKIFDLGFEDDNEYLIRHHDFPVASNIRGALDTLFITFDSWVPGYWNDCLGSITVYYDDLIIGLKVDGQIFGSSYHDIYDEVVATKISLGNDEVVTNVEFFNFPDWTHDFRLCYLTLFTKNSNETKKYGPYSTACLFERNATERVYGEIPANMSFQDFLARFSLNAGNYFKEFTISLPPWASGDPNDFILPEEIESK